MTEETKVAEVAPGVVVTLKGSHSGSFKTTAGTALKDIPGIPSLEGFVLRNQKGHMFSPTKALEAGEYTITTSKKANGG